MERGIHLHTNKPPACFRKYEKVEKVQFPSGQEKKKKKSAPTNLFLNRNLT